MDPIVVPTSTGELLKAIYRVLCETLDADATFVDAKPDDEVAESY